jgi:hypothetical protein
LSFRIRWDEAAGATAAPFKIIAVARAEVWSDRSLDTLVMPTGTQVERALWMLLRIPTS